MKLVIGLLVLGFAILDLAPAFRRMTLDISYIYICWVGGLSGHQGALRATFLLRAGLSKEAFIGTGVLTADLVDLARLPVYGAQFYATVFSGASQAGWLIVAATAAAFVGSLAGARLLPKLTLRGLHLVVGVLLIAVGAGLAAGLL